MGVYVNPGNDGFATIRNAEYIDKSGLIEFVNQTLDTPQKLTCSTRPRRFGKSFSALMLAAYYDHSCDSASLFDDLAIARDPSYHDHLNRYNVILLDVTDVIGRYGSPHDIATKIQTLLLEELRETFPDAKSSDALGETLLNVVGLTGRKFVFIVDEWDAVFREAKNDVVSQEDYILLLRTLFKNANITSKVIAGAFMTGILPIKKYGTQSAVSDFKEYTMVRPGPLAPYVGFTEHEVRGLCDKHGTDFSEMKRWYDGYQLPGVGSIYSPNSVMDAIRFGTFGSYWAPSETYTSLRDYIDMDFDGLQQAIVRMVAGEAQPVNTRTFQNDMTSITSRDNILTLLVHLGYLSFNGQDSTVCVPNEEVRLEFKDAIETGTHPVLTGFVRLSKQLLADTVSHDEEAVASAIQRVHDTACTPLFYNNEQALRSVVRIAYLAAMDHYTRIEELPGGHGYADIAFLPKSGSAWPPLIIELKWNKAASAAIDQIRDRRYPEALASYNGSVLLVGISYDQKTGQHSCKIEETRL